MKKFISKLRALRTLLGVISDVFGSILGKVYCEFIRVAIKSLNYLRRSPVERPYKTTSLLLFIVFVYLINDRLNLLELQPDPIEFSDSNESAVRVYKCRDDTGCERYENCN